MAEAVAVAPGQGASIQGPVGGPLEFKVCGEQTGGTLTALENVIPPGEGPPLHAHANEDELFFGRFAEHDGPDPSAFKSIGAEVGMDVLGPPLAQSDPV